MTFGFYIRYILISYLFIVLAIWCEIFHLRYNEQYFIVSLVTTALIIILLGLLFLKLLSMWIKNYRNPENVMKSNFREFFNGLKHKFGSQTFIITYLVKRTIIPLFMFIYGESDTLAARIAFAVIQGSCLIVTVTTRPMKQISDNIIEIVAECLLTVALILLFQMQSESTWNPENELVFINLLMGTSILTLIFGIMILISKLSRKIYKLLHKCKVIKV